MVIHDDNDAPEEVPFEIKAFDQNSIIFQPEHVKNDNKMSGNSAASTLRDDRSTADADKVLKKRKLRQKSVKLINSCSSSTDIENSPSITEISAEDMLELQTVYTQCKLVLSKIELKYGHLLNTYVSDSRTNILGPPTEKRSRITENEIQADVECRCILNKKIVFDEDGKEVMIDSLPENHICPMKLMSQKKHTVITNTENKNIQIEYHNNDTELSDNIQELRSILQNPDIETTYRNQVINKLKLIKQEHLNEIKFNKHSLIEKLKTNPDEIFNFEGANLSSLPGYSFY